MGDEDLELLRFYYEEGIDCTLTDGKEEKRVKERRESKLIQSTAIEAEVKRKEQQFMFPSEWVIEARKLASKCNSLSELRSAVISFEGCEIKKTATNTVFSDGSPSAKIMLIGEAPGVNEDMQGIPFCGASGMLLDKMLSAINLDRTKVYISNVVFWRPPGNRKPTNLELDICRPFVEKHIVLVSPQILVLVGGIACYSLLDNTKTISTLRGRFHNYTNQYLFHSITAVAIFHPAYLLRQPAQKRLAWEDLKKIRKYLDNNCNDI